MKKHLKRERKEEKGLTWLDLLIMFIPVSLIAAFYLISNTTSLCYQVLRRFTTYINLNNVIKDDFECYDVG